MDAIRRQERLEALAGEDPAYRLWERAYRENRQSFTAFADSQPRHIQKLLWAYAEGAAPYKCRQ